MKRLVLRLSALVSVVAVGFIAIAQAQRGIDSAEVQDSRSIEAAAGPLGEESLQPIDTGPENAESVPDARDSYATGPAANDPFGSGATNRAAVRIDESESMIVERAESEIPSADELFAEDQSATVTRAQYESTESGDRFSSNGPNARLRENERNDDVNERGVAPQTHVEYDANTVGHEPAPSTSTADPDNGLRRGNFDAAGEPAPVVNELREGSNRFENSPPARQDSFSKPGDRFQRPAVRENEITTASSDNKLSETAGSGSADDPSRSLQPGATSAASRRSFQPGSTFEPASVTAPATVPNTSPRRRLSDSSGTGNPRQASVANQFAAEEGSGQPGDARLEGVQAPVITLEKVAPAEVQLGTPSTFEIRVRNSGQVPARGVEIRDEVPQGARLQSSTPPASRGTRGELVWNLGTLNPGEESVVKLVLVPLEEGEIGSIAEVRYSARATSRTRVTRANLAVDVTVPKSVMIGQDVALIIKISNTGTGVATGVMVQQQLPENLSHISGSDLEYEVGTLAAGESRDVSLSVSAVKAGVVRSAIVVRADGDLAVEKVIDLEVLAPALQLVLKGPKRRYLDRKATYSISIANPGTAPAKDIRLVTHLPVGMKFVKADNYGEYDPKNRTVQWLLEELPKGEQGVVQLTTIPTQPGEHILSINGTAQQGLVAKEEQTILVEGIAAILFEVADVEDPIEVGDETTYEIRVVNQGTKAAANVRIVALLPREMKAVAAEGESRYVFDGQRVVFDALPRLAPKADTTFRIRVKGVSAGDARIRVELLTEEMATPVTKEESTHVYSDE